MAKTNDQRLKSFADRLDRLEDEKQGIAGDIKDVYAEVKSAGYNPKALRRVLADRRRKPDETLAAEIDLYRAALGEPGSTYRSAAAKLGVTKSKLHRLVPQNERGTAGPDHDLATGEVHESSGGVEGHAVEKPTLEAAAPVALPKCSTPAGVESGPLDTKPAVMGNHMSADLDMPPIPDFLRRTA